MIEGLNETLIAIFIVSCFLLTMFTMLFYGKEHKEIMHNESIRIDEIRMDAREQRNKEIAEMIEDMHTMNPSDDFGAGYNKALEELYDKVIC